MSSLIKVAPGVEFRGLREGVAGKYCFQEQLQEQETKLTFSTREVIDDAL